ncbi:D-ribose pyranase [Curtobacterium sp. MCJR17_055]|uniref:D-ribose pyranase n=1 Tax=unclassified Curtobacterium TaxID=257496 RepID=UPI000D8C2BC6|nr:MULTISPECIES: D-ribose pyranase [unclassified Curtobacterium]PYY34664.1 D-ribose pyranase [Curtobacterium sp. MCBD17_029]PYY57519.1 D-ribose pyranase [Curtobacterium sp. MCPF17_015]PYY58175.1 D-ribose pyranase [Curtobacterium sp. MCJR17_055]PZE93498.1 D-ribose pyranase [Curtobacterium sp. MCBD17_008]WIB37002.1 D-ribose pyranase [Curtobacterium sp. MCJR17_043]
MKKGGILNAELNAGLSRLGHGDLVVVADCGLPIPPGVPVVDLALVHGVPRFVDVLDALLGDAVFQECIAATEAAGTEADRWLTDRFPERRAVSHEELKTMSADARLFVRTGEATAFANAVLVCGVPF